jgi:hypothetical protein
MKKSGQALLDKSVRMLIERTFFEKYKVYRSSYHGGEFEGNDLRQLMRTTVPVMDDVESTLMGTLQSTRHEKCSDVMIQQVCSAYKRLLQYYNILRYFVRICNGKGTTEHLCQLLLCIKKAMTLAKLMFKKLPPKMHAVTRHLPEDFKATPNASWSRIINKVSKMRS